MKDTAKVILTIKKVLELSKNNPSEAEAKAAALKAQELLAKYHIDMKEVEDVDVDKVENIEEVTVDVPAKKWKYRLATIVAENFRCKHFYYGKGTVVFYGHETDANVAAETFKYLFDMGNRGAGREVDRVFGLTGTSRGVYNSYVSGFCEGVKSALDEQCTALMLVIPTDVVESYDERASKMRTLNLRGVSRGYDSECANAYNKGRVDGHSVAGKKKLQE